MHYAFLLSVVLLAAFTGCGRPTITGSARMRNCILNINDERKIQNPSESEIRQAVFALDTENEDSFLILERAELTYIQASGDHKVGFDLEYQEVDIDHHYRATRELTADEIVRAFVSYSTGADDWKRMTEWERITW